MLNKRYIKSIKRDIFCFDFPPVFLFQFLFCYILERKDKKWFKRETFCFDFLSNSFCFDFFSGKYWKRNVPSVRNPGRDISFPIFTRKEIETNSEPFSYAAIHLDCTCSLVIELLNGAN